MVIAIGSDLVNIERIERSINKYGERFINRIFTMNEQSYCNQQGNISAAYAKRFAAKEACAKALGTGIAQGVYWTDIDVRRDELGKPYIELTNGALERLKHLSTDEPCHVMLSMTDDIPWAQAFVVISERPSR